MPKFKVEAQSKYSAQDTFAKIKTVLETDPGLRKMDPGLKTDFNDSGMTGKAKGSQFEADLKVVQKGDGAHATIEVSLPLLLTPVKGMVQSTLQKKLDNALA